LEVRLALDTNAYASLFAQLRSQGTPIPTNDIWIAALVLQHDLVLLTGDGHFSKIPQIARETV
jgi:tRNA(fMet)-specific endonuclease VapC